jgi:hypothetical protein
MSAWRRFMSSTKKTPQHSVPIFNSPEADVVVAVAVAGAEGAAVAGVEVVLAVEDVEVAVDAPAFGPTGAAEAVWRALDVPQPGWGVAPPPPTYFYPPPGRPPLTRLRPVHKDEGPVEIPPVSKDPAPNATSSMPAPLRAAPATPAPSRPPSPPAAAPGSIQD